MVKAYYSLTKPGIIYGNILTTLAGFLLASKMHISFWLLLPTLLGTSLVIGSACVFNNWLDRDIDAEMTRTKRRALVTGIIRTRDALIFATLLGITGFSILTVYTNLLTVGVGLVGFVDYVIFYTFSKRISVYSTLIGSVSGATPIVAGYTAVTNHLDLGALTLFLIMVAWQMPHFYSIAIYRLDEYSAASVPSLPIKKGVSTTKIHILAYLLIFALAASSLTFLGYTGYTYLVVMVLLIAFWLWLDINGFRTNNDKAWARKMFFSSLMILLLFSAVLSASAFLP